MTNLSPERTELNQLAIEAKALYDRKKSLFADVLRVINNATMSHDEIVEITNAFNAAGADYNWQSGCWMNKYYQLNSLAHQMVIQLQLLYTTFEIEVVADVETPTSIDQVSLTVPLLIYVPQLPQVPASFRGAQYLPASSGIQLTPDMIVSMNYSVGEGSSIDDSGEEYFFKALNHFDLELDVELLEMALHQYATTRPELSHATNVQFDIKDICVAIEAAIEAYLYEAEAYPVTSRFERVAKLWEFLLAPQYNQSSVEDAANHILAS